MLKKLFSYLPILIFILFLIFIGAGYQDDTGLSTDSISVHFLDVGQGDSTLINMPNDEQILIDGGPGKSVLEEIGKVLPYYDHKIEYLILSHPHADHLAGFNYILDRYQVEKIYLNGYENRAPDYELFMSKIKEKGIPVQVLKRGDKVNLSDVQISVLWPDNSKIISNDLNETSLIFYLQKGEGRILFTGDAPTDIQESVISNQDRVDILKVSHHGSRTGSSKELIDKLRPRYSIISVGENNRFHHPAKEVVNLLRSSRAFRADLDGTISFVINEAGIFLE